jgi:hypothetical protein
MYGTRTKEEHVVGYTSVFTGEYHPSKVVPAGIPSPRVYAVVFAGRSARTYH